MEGSVLDHLDCILLEWVLAELAPRLWMYVAACLITLQRGILVPVLLDIVCRQTVLFHHEVVKDLGVGRTSVMPYTITKIIKCQMISLLVGVNLLPTDGTIPV